MMSLCGYADKAHPFFFERNFLDTVSVLFSFLFVTEERMIQWKTKNLFYPFKEKLNTSTSVTGMNLQSGSYLLNEITSESKKITLKGG